MYFFPGESHVFKTNLVDPAFDCVSKRLTQEKKTSLKVLQILKSSNPVNWQDWDKSIIFALCLLIVLCKTYPIIPRESNFEQYTVRNITLFSLAQIWKGETRTTPGSRLPAMITIHVILTTLELKGCYNNMMHLFLYSFPLLIFYHHFLEYQLP